MFRFSLIVTKKIFLFCYHQAFLLPSCLTHKSLPVVSHSVTYFNFLLHHPGLHPDSCNSSELLCLPLFSLFRSILNSATGITFPKTSLGFFQLLMLFFFFFFLRPTKTVFKSLQYRVKQTLSAFKAQPCPDQHRVVLEHCLTFSQFPLAYL